MPAGLGFGAGDGEQPPGPGQARALLYDFGSEAGGAELNSSSEVENSRMSVNKWVVGVCAGVAACGSVGVFAQQAAPTPSLAVSKASQLVQTPATAGASGISYVQTGAATSSLRIYTQGFLFCGNISDSSIVQSPAIVTLLHEDQSFSPAHPWTFPTATDVVNASYTGSLLTINPAAQTSLTCLGTANDGSVAASLSDGIFDNGYDSATSTNYSHLVNWIPPQGFSWSAPDWTQVPSDACHSSEQQPAIVEEDVACVAASGLQPPATGGAAIRSGRLWTTTDGVTFTYLARVDARVGAQVPGGAPVFQVPALATIGSPEDINSPKILIQDAFEGGDASHLGYLSASGQYCFLTDLPSTLNSSTCSGAQTNTITGALSQYLTLGAFPNVGTDLSFYIVVTRTIQGTHSNFDTPVVGLSVLLDPAVAAEGGDQFTGDDIAFGFMPTSTGFPWMTGQ